MFIFLHLGVLHQFRYLCPGALSEMWLADLVVQPLAVAFLMKVFREFSDNSSQGRFPEQEQAVQTALQFPALFRGFHVHYLVSNFIP